MNKNITNNLIILFTGSYLVILSIIIYCSEFNTNVVKDITLITTSFSTLIIALLLYDRFNYRKIIFERKLEIVLDLLEHIKKTRIQINYRNTETLKIFVGTVSVDRLEIKNLLLNNYFNKEAKIILEAIELRDYVDEIMRFKTNPFMPIEIANSLEFLSMEYFEGVEVKPEYQSEYIKISINKSVKNFKDLKGWYNLGKEISFDTFIKNYLKSLDEIENWINKHSNTEAKLNL
ncbi:hypothetical protein WFZ85_05865 [Flavobacterium sp. j3]|uniref:SMODS-associated NUDIX domain-containing protein n=1 Tax=Flavobacterium aureirubrum TaxID=3133147 RepID=A0ABU9N342_9FLAO